MNHHIGKSGYPSRKVYKILGSALRLLRSQVERCVGDELGHGHTPAVYLREWGWELAVAVATGEPVVGQRCA